MADKGKARSVAIEAGVPVLPGSLPIDPNDTSLLLESANNIGLPLLVKATGGGGGIGMQVAESLEDLPKIAKSVSSLAERTFGNNEILTREMIAKKILDYLEEEVKLGTKVNHIMRHTVGLYHGQPGSKDWKRYLSENMMARDSDFQKVNHIMKIAQNNEKSNQVSS